MAAGSQLAWVRIAGAMQTPLDRALAAAMESPESQPAYYDVFLRSDLFVPTVDMPEGEEQRRAAEGETFSPVVIESDGKLFLILFDTVERLQAWAQREIGFVRLPAHALVESVDPQLHWALNVGTEHHKQFVPEELAWLRRRIAGTRATPMTLDRDTKVLIGSPSEVPDGLLEALTVVLRRNPEVREAHLAAVGYEGETRAHLAFVGTLEADTDVEEAIRRDVVLACGGLLGEGQTLDIFLDDSGVAQTARQTVEPFYTRERP